MSGFVKKSVTDSINDYAKATTGTPTLDKIMPISYGSINAIFESENSFIHNTILQIFISKCIFSKTPIFAISKNPKTLISFQVVTHPNEENDKIKDLLIAWRYQTLGNKNDYSPFNLRENIPLDQNTIIDDFEKLLEILKTKEKCCFAIFSLFSPLFSQFGEIKNDIHNILFTLKQLAKQKKHCIFLSIPKYLINDNISNYFDNIMEISSKLCLTHETSKYNTFVDFLKLNGIRSLRVNNLESYKYGLILKARKIIIERIDIPPDESTPQHNSCNPGF